MSDETLHVHATLSATDSASPVLRGLLKNIDALRAAAKRFNTEFSNLGRSASQSLDGVTRASKSAADSMRGLSNTSERAAASYRSAWAKADQDRTRSARSMYSTLMSEERSYQALLAKRSSAGTSPARGSGPSAGRIVGGTFLGVGAASAVRQLGHEVIAAERSIGRGIVSAFKERLKISKSETQAEVFGELTREEITKLRKNSLDRLGIKFGAGIEGTLGVATELSKAGIGKEVLGDATELVLKAKMALDVSEKETAQLFGGLASFIAFDKTRYGSVSNAIAVANKGTKASGTEIIEGLKRSLSALATTGGRLTPEQLAGLVGTAIDVGIQPGKSGNFLSHFIGTVGSADTVHGQRAKDLQEAAQQLGFGSRSQMAQSMRSDPLESIYKILDNLAKLPEKLRIRVAKDLGGEQWFDELLSMVLAKDKLKQVERDIEADKGFLDRAALKAIRSMSGAYASVIATTKLAQEKIGGGFDKAFTQIADAILRHADTFNFDSIRDHFEALTDGLLQGFGLENWGQAVDWLAGQFSPSTIESWRAWGRGFAAGIKSWGESLMSAFSIVRRLTGNDPESTGKLVANLAVLATSLIVVNPLLLLLAGAVALLTSPFALFIASVVALKKTLDWVADKMFTAFVSIVDAIKDVALSMINKLRGWIGLSPVGGAATAGGHGASGSWEDGSVQKQSFLGPSNDAAASFQKASYSSAVTNRDSIPSFNGGGGAAGSLDRASFERKFAGTALAGKYDQIIVAADANNIPPALLAGIIAHETGNGSNLRYNNVAGLMNPETGSRTKLAYPSIDAGIAAAGRTVGKRYREAGGNLDKMGSVYAPPGAANDPRGLNGGWAGGVRKQANALSGGVVRAGAGDAVSAGEKYLGLNEWTDTQKLAAYLGADPRGKSNAWCARFVNASLKAAGGQGTGSAAAASFYKWGDAVSDGVKRGDIMVAPHHVGMATGKVDAQGRIQMISGNHSDAVGYSWEKPGSYQLRRGNPVGNVPTPAEAVRNVPPVPTGGGLGAGAMRGGFGPATININGNSHDPEVLANLVQRRIDESMQWRMHDTESEYT
ncbi:phage tail tape measure protein [Bradyrhizobium sp. S3.5.5]|uniref:phage tail tape measure protein n=1 Tax=Bradyrhizobium sp. S3.5.5 TaxID=3156430 RepID=UPI00339ADE21